MNDSPYRHARKTSFTAALCLAILFATVALLGAARSQAATGGAGVAVPAPAATTDATTTTAFNEAELSFTPYRYAGASWYGGTSMWGRSTACGQTLKPSTIGVANKTLPCGTPVKFVWHGHSIVAPVIDRGPYIRGRAWDLTSAAAEALDFEGIGRIRYAVAIEYASKGL
jgi:rare lipoprotein A